MDDQERDRFLADAERIAEEVMAMSEEEVQAYIVEHNLEHLLSQERIEGILRQATVAARRNSFRVIK